MEYHNSNSDSFHLQARNLSSLLMEVIFLKYKSHHAILLDCPPKLQLLSIVHTIKSLKSLLWHRKSYKFWSLSLIPLQTFPQCSLNLKLWYSESVYPQTPEAVSYFHTTVHPSAALACSTVLPLPPH